jgi:hypothetical protein
MVKNRHLKSKPNASWTELRVEIKSISQELKIDKDKFSEVNFLNSKSIENKLWNKFSTNNSSGWLWENLKEELYSIQIENPLNINFKELLDLNESVWILLNETVNELTKYWIYEGKTSAIQKILIESSLVEEVIIASKKYEWIIIINHHNYLIATGSMINKLKEIEKETLST